MMVHSISENPSEILIVFAGPFIEESSVVVHIGEQMDSTFDFFSH